MITIATLAQATEQEVFDHIVGHMLNQDRKCKFHDVCSYRNSEGLSCAAGCLFTEEEYKSIKPESCAWDTLVSQGKVPKEHGVLILNLQKLHDSVPEEEWYESTKRISVSLGLKFKFYKQECEKYPAVYKFIMEYTPKVSKSNMKEWTKFVTAINEALVKAKKFQDGLLENETISKWVDELFYQEEKLSTIDELRKKVVLEALVNKKDYEKQIHDENILMRKTLQWLGDFVLTANDGGQAWCSVRNNPGAQEWFKDLQRILEK